VLEKIDRNELFALLGRSAAAAAPVHGTDPQDLPAPDWEDALETESAPIEFFKTTEPLPAQPLASVPAAPLLDSKVATPAGKPGPVVTTMSRGPSTRADQAKLQRLLEHSVPRLWKYAIERSNSSDHGIQRQKLRELLVWMFEKEGYAVSSNAPAPYRLNNKDVKGRVDLVIQRKDGTALLAIETNWTKEPAAVLKLLGWSRKVPVVWIVGAPCESSALVTWRRFADELSSGRSVRWLPILHLVHGWING
jgi:hypothetical protein